MKPQKKTKPKSRKSTKESGNIRVPPKPNLTEPEFNENEILENFALELKWCLQHLEISLASQEKNPKKVEEMTKCYKMLASPKQPMVKKRQVMRSYFGDYRDQMAKEEEKFKYAPPNIKEVAKIPSCSAFIKKSSKSTKELSSPTKTNFAFNFTIDT